VRAPARSRTRVLWAPLLDKVCVGRPQDWTKLIGDRFCSFHRGQSRNGLVGSGSLEWRSKKKSTR
jgi:hypothetical protein